MVLARDLLKRYGTLNRKPSLSFDHRATQAILQHPWPGNVRELQNRIQRAVIMSDSRRITDTDLEIEADQTSVADGHSSEASSCCGLRQAREYLEREMVVSAVGRHEGNISAAAKELGVSRPTLYELMNKLGVSRI